MKIFSTRASRWVSSSVMILAAATTLRVSGQHLAMDREAVQEFADGFFQQHLESQNIPGAAVAVVHNGEIIFQNGYGVSDIEVVTPVDAEKTRFEFGSVTKLFTATALMQLVSSQEIDLDKDINTYLDVLQIPAGFDSPVTAHHLLTHTAGFDDRNIGYYAESREAMMPLEEYLVKRMPARVLPPGTVTSYSNHGYGVAGLMVQNVSGMSYSEYIQANILSPLAMSNSSLNNLADSDGDTAISKGYALRDGVLEAESQPYRNVLPAGGLIASAADVGRFLISHLDDSNDILIQDARRKMHEQQFSNHRDLPGIGYGFIEQFWGQYRLLQHGGDTPGFASLVAIIPESGTGFVFVTNRRSNVLRKQFFDAFMTRFFSVESRPISGSVDNSSVDVEMLTGSYRLNRFSRNTVEKLSAVFTNEYEIYSVGDTLVTLDGVRWLPISELVYSSVDGSQRLAFQYEPDGKLSMFRSLNFGGVFPAAYERLPWYDTRRFVNEFYLSWVLVLSISWIVWPLGALILFVWRRVKKKRYPVQRPIVWIARLSAIVFGVTLMWFAVSFIQPFLRTVQQGGGEWLFGVPESASRLQFLPYVQVCLATAMIYSIAVIWVRRYASLLGRIHYTILAVTAVAWLIFLFRYNVLLWGV